MRDAWAFLRPYVEQADGFVFSRARSSWEQLDSARIHLIAPSIDAFATKNQDLDAATVRAVLLTTGILRDGERRRRAFARQDGSPGRVTRRAEIFEDAPLAPATRRSCRSRAGTSSRTRSA